MRENPYTNRELDEKFNILNVLIREKHDDSMIKSNEILMQQKITNGSVASLKLWQSYIKGGLAVVLIIVVPIIIYLLNHKA